MTDSHGARPLDALAADLWDACLDADPIWGTALGEARVIGRIPDATPAGQAALRGRFAALLERLDRLEDEAAAGDAHALAHPHDEDAITRSAMREELLAQLGRLDTGLADWNVDTLDGIPVVLLNTADFQPAGTAAEREALLERWRGFARMADDHAANLRRSLEDGRVACTAPVDRVIDILGEVLALPDAEWPLMRPVEAAFGHRPAVAGGGAAPGAGSAAAGDASGVHGPATSAERDRFAAEVERVIRDHVRPAFARLRQTLEAEVRPAARPPERPGLCHVPGGEAAYRTLARIHTSLDLSPEALHRIGLEEIERIDAETEALASRVLGTRSRRAAVAALRGDPALHFTTREEVFATAEASLARAIEAIPAWFGRLPQAPCEVVRMGAHEEEHSTIAFYRSPAQDGSRPGQYYLNTAHPETRPRYEAEALAYHESVPGHHLQIAIAQELDGLPAFRRHLGSTAFIEGWGLYTERLADEMGLYSGDLDRIGVLSFDAWRASRLVVDTGLHALGWTRGQAIDFLLDHTVLAPNNIANEVDRYLVMPGQALAYKAGQLELLRLRDDARRRLGSAFDMRAFHDAVLGHGALALPTLRGTVEAWIERATAAA